MNKPTKFPHNFHTKELFMSRSNRRVFMMQVVAGGTALASATMVSAAPKRVEENEPEVQ